MHVQVTEISQHRGAVSWLRAFVTHRPGLGIVGAVAILPWFVMIGICPGGLFASIVAMVVGILMFGLGEAWVRAFVPEDARVGELHLLSLPLGFITAGAAWQIAAHLGVPLRAVGIGLGLPAIWGLAKSMRGMRDAMQRGVEYGWIYALLSILVGLVYFLPVALVNGALTKEQGYSWVSVDTCFHHAIAGQIADETAPVLTPGIATVPLRYHMGRHAIAAAIHKAFGTNVADALLRITRALSFLALLMAVIALARLSSLGTGQSGLAGIAAIFFLFFLPGMQKLVSDLHWPLALAWRQGLLEPGPQMINWDRHLVHLYVDGSCVAALIVIMVVAALTQATAEGVSKRQMPWAPMVATCLGVCMNGVVAAACFAVVTGVALLNHWRSLRVYPVLIAFGATFSGVMILAGYYTKLGTPVASNASGLSIADASQWAARIAWTTVGMLTIIASAKVLCSLLLLQGSKATKQTLVLFTLALLGIFVSAVLQGYPLWFLGPLLSVYAGAGFAFLWSNQRMEKSDLMRRLQTWRPWLRWYGIGFLLCAFSAAMLIAYLSPLKPLNREADHSPLANAVRTHFAVVVAVVAIIMWGLARITLLAGLRTRRVVLRSAAVAAIVLGLLGFLRVHYNYGWDGIRQAVVVDPARTQSLLAIKELTPINALLVTTHHRISEQRRANRAYSYSAASQRQMLLEGWEYSEPEENVLEQLKKDNQTLFETRDDASAQEIVRRYGVTHILLEPNEKLGFDVDKVSWLRRIPMLGSMTLYAVVNPTSGTITHHREARENAQE